MLAGQVSWLLDPPSELVQLLAEEKQWPRGESAQFVEEYTEDPGQVSVLEGQYLVITPECRLKELGQKPDR